MPINWKELIRTGYTADRGVMLAIPILIRVHIRSGLKEQIATAFGMKKGTYLTILIHPPWWRTWWAYCIYGLLLIVAVLAIYRYQKQRVIQAERRESAEKGTGTGKRN